MPDLQIAEGNDVRAFGSSDVGSGALAVLVGPVPATTATGKLMLTDFGSTQVDDAADGQYRLEISNDGFQYDLREVSRITAVAGGTVFKTFDSPIVVDPGEEFRVRYVQGTPGRASSEVFGVAEKQSVRYS
jgi:hypothetical protein